MKNYLLEVLLKKAGPSALRGAIGVVTVWLASNADLLKGLGFVYDDAAKTLTLNFGTLETWITTVGIFALTAGLVKVFNHEGEKLLPKKD